MTHHALNLDAYFDRMGHSGPRTTTILLQHVLLGLGGLTLTPNLNVWLASTVPAALRGRALGGLSAALFLGGFVSPLVSQPLADVIGLGATFGATGVVLVAGALTLLLASRIHSRGRRAAPRTASVPHSLPAAWSSCSTTLTRSCTR